MVLLSDLTQDIVHNAKVSQRSLKDFSDMEELMMNEDPPTDSPQKKISLLVPSL